MTSGLENYLGALEETKKLLDSPVGFSTYNASSKVDEIIIKQNNTILQLLVQLHNKLEQIDRRIKILDEEKNSKEKIDELIYKINDLKIGEGNNRSKNPDEEILFGKI